MKETKVLIVDDDRSILLVLERLLTEKGLDVSTTADKRQERAKLLNSGDFTIALLDINIPGKSGLELLKEAKEAEVSGTQIIIMTAEQSMTNTLESHEERRFRLYNQAL